jgi:hypothetical protein
VSNKKLGLLLLPLIPLSAIGVVGIVNRFIPATAERPICESHEAPVVKHPTEPPAPAVGPQPTLSF